MSHEPTDTDIATQQRISALVRSIDVGAPASLQRSVRELNASARPATRPTWRRPLVLIVAPLAGAAVLAVALVLALGSSGGPPPPTVLQASLLSLRPATQGAPEEDPRAPGRLKISAAGIPYPYWNRRFRWQAAGARSDTLGGRVITTVFYANTSGGRIAPPAAERTAPPAAERTESPPAERIGYSIVAGQVLPIPSAGRSVVWDGVRFQVIRTPGTTVVTWRRAGHTCILVSSKVSSKTLLTLANWQAT